MVNYNDRGKYEGKTFVEVSDYATNRALQTDRLRAFGLIKSEAAISIFEECIGVIRQCRVHVFTERWRKAPGFIHGDISHPSAIIEYSSAL